MRNNAVSKDAKTRRAIGFLLPLMLSCCMTVDIESVRHLTPSGPPLNAALHREYLALADVERAQDDWRSASLFAWKARSAARGEAVPPESLDDWTLPATARDYLSASRARLVAALAEAQRIRLPDLAARAQARFDCWLEALEQRGDAGGPLPCEQDFARAMSELESALVDE